MSFVRTLSSRCGRGDHAATNRGVAGPDGPDQPGELVGHRDDGQVEVAPVTHLQRPPVQAGERLPGAPTAGRGQHDGAATVDQHAPRCTTFSTTPLPG